MGGQIISGFDLVREPDLISDFGHVPGAPWPQESEARYVCLPDMMSNSELSGNLCAKPFAEVYVLWAQACSVKVLEII